MSSRRSSRPAMDPRLAARAASNDNEAVGATPGGNGRLARVKRRMALGFTLTCLVGGAALGIVSGHVDSVIISHASRSAMIFGLVGLRRVAENAEPGIEGQA